MIDIRSLTAEDRADWEVLARGYKGFYSNLLPADAYDKTWQRLLDGPDLHGIGAWLDGRLVGIAHYLCHAAFWTADCCYLQDLYVAEEARGQGAGRALIDEVALVARARGCARLYWTTKQDNEVARALYDKVAEFRGFIRYDHPV